MYSSSVQEKIAHWIAVISDLLVARRIALPETAELFVELDDDSDSCFYYFVDHAAQTEFWIEELPTDFLGLPEVVSDSHLRASRFRAPINYRLMATTDLRYRYRIGRTILEPCRTFPIALL